VIGRSSNTLTQVTGDPDTSKHNVALVVAGNKVDITDRISGGKIGGLLEYRDQVLDPAINELGRIALALADTMNSQHQKGMDLDGNLGGLLFNDINDSAAITSRLSANSQNTSIVSSAFVQIDDVSLLKASDYEISFGSANTLTVERLSDGKTFSLSGMQEVGTPAELSGMDNAYYADFSQGVVNVALDGMEISIDVKGRFVTGDRFLVQPTRLAGAEFDTVLTDGRQLALASPVRITESADNVGTGVAEVNITDVSANTFQRQERAMSPPVEIVFSGKEPTTFTVYDISVPDLPVVFEADDTGPMVDQTFVAGEPIELDGYEIIIRNQPVAGDRFSFSYNTDGVSDNRNALHMSNLQLDDTIEGGSYQDIYGRLIERVGTETSVSVINRDASQAVLTSSQESKAALVGVNLDEEAAKLIQFQQAYQASAQLIRASQTLFDSLLNAI
uniref:FlgK family flagellar hook-associated protein n=1 Tax=Pontibacterium sp. TaxID=2036026 RepID=UPI003566A58B